MRIVILQGAFLPIPPLLGGAVEKMWFRLGQEFSRLGHDVLHISRIYGHLDAPCADPKGVVHIRVKGYDTPQNMPKRLLLDGLYSRRAARVVPSFADVVVTNSFWSPVFLHGHCASVYMDVARMPKGQMRLYRRVSRFRANSTPVAEAIMSELPSHRHDRVRVIPNPLPFDAKETVDLDSKENVILYCGRIHPEKGLDLLTNAIPKIPLGEWRVRIVGPWEVSMGGAGRSYADRLVKQCAGYPVELLGPVFDEDRLNDLYRRASVFVYPSVAETGETFGLAPLEAMAWGAVPVVSNLRCFQDFITHEHNGLVFDHRGMEAAECMAVTLHHVMASIQTRRRLAAEALQVRTSHSLSHIARLFIDDFESVVGDRRDNS